MKIRFETKRANENVDVAPNESILFAGLRQGLALPHECASGTCGSCQAQLLDGDLNDLWVDAPGKSHISGGVDRFLMCQTACKTDATIKLFGRLKHQTDGYPTPAYASGIITHLEKINPDIAVVRLQLEIDFPFIAGQFAMLCFPQVEGWRAYSMCQSDTHTGELEFVIKRLHGGAVSNCIFNARIIGQRVEVFGPLGRSCLNHGREDKAILMIAGGSGIAGIIAVLQDIISKGSYTQNRIEIFFGIKSPRDDFFLDRLSTLVMDTSGQIEVTVVYSETDTIRGMHPKYGNINLASGFVHDVALAALRMQNTNDDLTYFVAGPPIVVTTAEAILQREFGVSADRIRLDRFG